MSKKISHVYYQLLGSTNILNIAKCLVVIITWPISLVMEGYHDNENNATLVAMPLVIGILLPIIMPWLLINTPISVAGRDAVFLGGMWYLLVGIISNFIAKISSGEGFLIFPKIFDSE